MANVRAAEFWRAGDDTANTRHDLAFHPTRPVLALRGGRATGEVVFDDAAARGELKRYAWEVGVLSAVAFSPDGLRCAAGPGQVVVWDVDG
ncbi:MAG: hypothetical protein K2V38_14740 [Gemmataceae bacterium]|nr:hypothetical protein [Gemmataceae bacterium]